MRTASKQLPDWILVAACLLPFLGFWSYGLFDLDEGFYGAVVVDMIRRGDWLTPTLNGVPWFEKPILAYWLAIPSVQLFGEAVGPRLPSVLCTLLTIWVLFRFVRDHLGAPAGRLTALLYSTNLLVVGIGRMMMTDAPLVLCITMAVTTFWRSLGPEQASRKLRLWSAFFVGLAILAKGPVGAILFLAIVGSIYVAEPLLRPRYRGFWLLGVLILLGTVASWYLPCYLVNGRVFIDKFLIEQNIGRFAGGDKAHTVPLWAHPVYFPVILALSALPWVFFLTKPARAAAQGEVDEPTQARFGLLVKAWLLVPLVFFSLSGTKLPHYILPAVAPLSIWFALSLVAGRRDWPWEKLGLAWSACVLVLAQYAFALDWTNRMREVQEAAKLVRKGDVPLYVYKIGGTGETSITTQLRETSHPSISFYLKRPLVDTSESSVLASAPLPHYVLTPIEVFASDPAVKEFSALGMPANGQPCFEDIQKRVPFPHQDRYVLLLREGKPVSN
ncbi:MAG: glycosyltransferase family 39 protein [Armatimonadetes bacterium]|nr:glycosyltransferase family 39 protein [Armatimonadota bacterium]